MAQASTLVLLTVESNAKLTLPLLLNKANNACAVVTVVGLVLNPYNPILLPGVTLPGMLLFLNYLAENLRSFLGWNIDVNLL